MPRPPHDIDEMLRVIEARDAEVGLSSSRFDKLKLQLMRRMRVQFGASSERFDATQIALLEAV